MIAALTKEILLTKVFIDESNGLQVDKKELIETLYFGGGTPSIIDIKDLELLLAALQEKFIFSRDIEITLEANPDDISPEKLTLWKQAGINRLSAYNLL